MKKIIYLLIATVLINVTAVEAKDFFSKEFVAKGISDKEKMVKNAKLKQKEKNSNCEEILSYLTANSYGKATNKYILALKLWEKSNCDLVNPNALKEIFSKVKD